MTDAASAGRVRTRSLELPLEVSLPDRKQWTIEDGPSWFVARHAATSSVLALRSWRAARQVRREECAEQARVGHPELSGLGEDSIVEQRAVSVPRGFAGDLTVGVVPSGAGLRGYAYVFSASVGHCFAAIFTTELGAGAQPGPGQRLAAEEELARRLRVAVSDILERVRTRAIDDRAVRRRLVPSTR